MEFEIHGILLQNALPVLPLQFIAKKVKQRKLTTEASQIFSFSKFVFPDTSSSVLDLCL